MEYLELCQMGMKLDSIKDLVSKLRADVGQAIQDGQQAIREEMEMKTIQAERKETAQAVADGRTISIGKITANWKKPPLDATIDTVAATLPRSPHLGVAVCHIPGDGMKWVCWTYNKESGGYASGLYSDNHHDVTEEYNERVRRYS